MENNPKPQYDLSKVSPKYIDDRDLRDPPARLFRATMRKLGMNLSKWNCYLADHLRWSITTTDKTEAKKQRTNALGNIKSVYFMTHTLSFQKLLAGLSILKIQECEVILRMKDHKGEMHEVSEKFKISGSLTKDDAE